MNLIRQGLQETLAQPRGDERGVRTHRPRAIDVKAERNNLPGALRITAKRQAQSFFLKKL